MLKMYKMQKNNNYGTKEEVQQKLMKKMIWLVISRPIYEKFIS